MNHPPLKPYYLDFTPGKRFWGHNFQLCNKLDEQGYRWSIGLWYPRKPDIGMFMLLGLKEDDIRHAIIEKIEACEDPKDMYIAEINIQGAKELIAQVSNIQEYSSMQDWLYQNSKEG